ncbi:hypothetical protein BJX65DRAFT_311413 [Aspergillus insuetus]
MGYRTKLRNGASMIIMEWSHHRRGEYKSNHPIWNRVFKLARPDDCSDASIMMGSLPYAHRKTVVIEHIVEQQVLKQHFQHVAQGQLSSKGTPGGDYSPLSMRFILALNSDLLINPPPMMGGGQSLNPVRRAMNVIGSKRNSAGFVLLSTELNLAKRNLWMDNKVIADDTMETAVRSRDHFAALDYLRRPVAVINYLNHPVVNAHLVETINGIRAELARGSQQWVSLGNLDEHAPLMWSYWVKDHLATVGLRADNFVYKWALDMEKHWASRSGSTAAQVREALRNLREFDFTIRQDGID